MRILFVDFDGCLHVQGQLPFEYLPVLDRLVAQASDVYVVVSSSWRETRSLDEIKNFFPERLACRTIAVTPVLPAQPFQRQHECLAWLNMNSAASDWLAVDDDASLFQPGHPNVVICDPERGLVGPATLDKLSRWITREYE